MLPAREMIRIILAILIANGVLTIIEAEKAMKKADANLPNSPIDELSMEQLVESLK
jgi:hypothetical protein